MLLTLRLEARRPTNTHMNLVDRLHAVRKVAICAAGALVLLPAAANAAQVRIVPTPTGPQLKITAIGGEANDIQVNQYNSSSYGISDFSGTPITAANSTCVQSSATLVTCSVTGLDSAEALLDDGDDRIYFPVFFDRVTVLGGDGNDTLGGSPVVAGSVLDGGAGDDVLQPGTGAQDVLIGGSGFDKADYRGRGAALTLTNDGTASSGASLEGDTISSDIEGLEGGAGADVLLGGGANDYLDGNNGDDRVEGAAGDDVVIGGNNNDRVDGGTGIDLLRADTGDDVVLSRDGGQPDDVQCGDGADSATGDREDRFDACETLDVPAAPAGSDVPLSTTSPATDPPATTGSTLSGLSGLVARLARPVTITRRNLQISRSGKLLVTLRCASAQAGGCVGEIVITVSRAQRARASAAAAARRTVTLARAKFSLKPGQTRKVSAKVSRRGVRQAFGPAKQADARPRARRVKATMSVSVRAANGSRTTTMTPVTVTLPKG